jgi:hypothetical protein
MGVLTKKGGVMAWKQKELPTYPAIGFELGEFVTDFSDTNWSQTKVENTLYYENGKIIANFEYNVKRRIFERTGRSYIEMKPEDVQKEIEELNKKLMDKDMSDIEPEFPSEEEIKEMEVEDGKKV